MRKDRRVFSWGDNAESVARLLNIESKARDGSYFAAFRDDISFAPRVVWRIARHAATGDILEVLI